MQRLFIAAVILGCWLTTCQTSAAGDPSETVWQSEQVLGELMTIPGRQIPQALLHQAQAVVVIPNVIKIGFIAGARRGHGVVLARDAEGEWGLPQFLTLTGGSVGWQAGIQGTDIVLVFTTRKGVEGLMRGKFTIGADAAATAGPVGRNASIGTDGALQAEIFSYSRSRGLFLGVSIDGSVLEVDPDANAWYYGVPMGQLPRRVPDSAAKLRNYVAELTQQGAAQPPVVTGGPTATGGPTTGGPAFPEPPGMRIDALRRSLNQNYTQLQSILTPEWRNYLALPKDVLEPNGHPDLEALNIVQKRYAQIESSPNYKQLAQRPEFQSTYELLREFTSALASTRPTLQLPPPPTR